MRALVIAAVGLGTSAVLFVLSGILEGFPAASFLMLSYLLIPVAVGVAVASLQPNADLGLLALAGSREDSPRRSGRFGSVKPSRCQQCRGNREQSGQVWVCRRCDLTSARA